MTIKHLPSGLFPHFDCGFQRKPYEPTLGEQTIIDCRVDEGMPEQQFFLKWKVDGVAQTDIDGQRFFPEGNKAVFYRFVLPNFTQPCRVEYYVVGVYGGETVTTKTFSFEVLEKIVFDREPQVGIADDSAYVVNFEKEGRKSAIRIELSDHIRLQIFGQSLTVKEKVSNVQVESGEYHLSVCATPFSLNVYKGKSLIFQLNGSNGKLTLYVDKDGIAHSVECRALFEGEAFFGLGEKFDSVNQNGLQPLNYVVEQYAHQQDKTYLPIPFFYTEQGIGLLQKTSYRSRFYLNVGEKAVRILSRCHSNGIVYDCFVLLGQPKEQIKQYHALTGMPLLPPKWSFGPWMSSNGWNTQTEAEEQIVQMKEYSIPSTVMVLEAWSDEENFYIFNDARYRIKDGKDSFVYDDFSFDKDAKWSSPKEFCDKLKENNLKLILWQIPVVKYDYRNNGQQLDNDEQYAIKQNYLIKCDDGVPYRITENWFHHSVMPDFYNKDACKWWFDKRKYLLTELGVAGFKTDGGEFIFDETAVFCNGQTVEQLHNDYPNRYVGAYHDCLDETLGVGEGITFSRAGYTGAQKYPIHWAGDQVSEFSELKGQLVAGLSLGLSGVPFWGFDIGGFAGQFPTTELYLRSTAFATFAPVMQFHSEPRYGQYYMTERKHFNNDRSPWNMAVANDDEKIIPIYRKFANLRMNLLPYIYATAQNDCCAKSLPMMRHLAIDYTSDKRVLGIQDEYMFGEALLVAPIYVEGDKRQVYFPEGQWYGLFDGKVVDGKCDQTLSCPLDQALVYLKKGHMLPLNLNKKLVACSCDVDAYIANDMLLDQLCLFDFEAEQFELNLDGKRVSVKCDAHCYDVQTEGVDSLIIADLTHSGKSIRLNGQTIQTQSVDVLFNDRVVKGMRVK